LFRIGTFSFWGNNQAPSLFFAEHFFACGVYEGMFEQSILLSSAPGKKAGALAISLSAQTFAVGMLLLIPLLYTEQLPFVQLQIPTFLPAAPPSPVREPAPRRHTAVRAGGVFTIPRLVPPLYTQPDVIDNAPEQVGRIDAGPIVPLGPSVIFTQVLPPPPRPVIEPGPSKPITVTSDIQSAKLLRKVTPIYPRLAIIARVSGTVHLMGTIGKDGMIEQVQVVSGPPMLAQAAVDAVRQWIYRPTMLNNEPVDVIAPIDVIFSLSR
jgi:protein TonB